MAEPYPTLPPDSYILSEKNYPELFLSVQHLKAQFSKDYPNETFPHIIIEDNTRLRAEYVGIDGRESVILSKGMLTLLGGSDTVAGREKITAILAHEFSHDALNHMEKYLQSTLDSHRTNEDINNNFITNHVPREKETDALASRYTDKIPEALEAAFINRRDAILSDKTLNQQTKLVNLKEIMVLLERRDAAIEVLNRNNYQDSLSVEVPITPNYPPSSRVNTR